MSNTDLMDQLLRRILQNAPVQLNFLDSDSIKYITKAEFKLTILSETEYLLETEKTTQWVLFPLERK